MSTDFGIVTAYGYALSKGYEGTEEEFAELLARQATVAAEAAASADEAAASEAEVKRVVDTIPESYEDFTRDLVLAQADQPTARDNRIWVDTDAAEEISVPEMSDLDALANTIAGIEASVTLYQFGAECDGVHDDTEAVREYAAYCANNNKVFIVPYGVTVKVANKITIKDVRSIQVFGTIYAPEGIEFWVKSSNGQPLKWYFNNVTFVKSTSEEPNPEAALTLAGMKSGEITIARADKVVLYATKDHESVDPDYSITSIAYNRFNLGYVKSLVFLGRGEGWINENFFYGGRIENLLFADGGEYNHNNNHFYDSTFEKATIDFKCGGSNYIHNARFESVREIHFSKKAFNNYVHCALVSQSAPGSIMLPTSFWHDESGTNFYTYGAQPAVYAYQKMLTAYTNNYNADLAYPSGRKLSIKPIDSSLVDSSLVETNLIPISHSVGILVETNEPLFRGRVLIFDKNGARIMDEPEHTPKAKGGNGMEWSTDEHCYVTYASGSYSNRNETIRQTFSRIAMPSSKNEGGEDTGVYYIQIILDGNLDGTKNINIDYLRFIVTAPWYTKLNPFKTDKLVASSAPATGDWEDTTLCYNIGGSGPNAWIYRGGQWSTAF